MFDYLIGSLLLAWFLSWFGFDSIFITGSNELFGWKFSSASYYFIFFLVGLLLGLIQMYRNRSKN